MVQSGNAPLDNSNTNEFIRGNRFPDTEDINNNKSLDQTEAFYESIKSKIKKLNGNNELDTTILGNHYRQTTLVTAPNGQVEKMVQVSGTYQRRHCQKSMAFQASGPSSL